MKREAQVSAAIVLAWFSQNIPFSVPERLVRQVLFLTEYSTKFEINFVKYLQAESSVGYLSSTFHWLLVPLHTPSTILYAYPMGLAGRIYIQNDLWDPCEIWRSPRTNLVIAVLFQLIAIGIYGFKS